MWPHKDLGWWGFWVALAALVGAYPFSLLANLTSPKLQNWWAARSRAALEKRISKLQAELAELETLEPITAVESVTLSRIEALKLQMITSVHILLGTIFIAVRASHPTDIPKPWYYIFYGWIVAATSLNFSRVFWKDSGSDEFKSSTHELSLREDIQKLKAELVKSK